MRLSDDEIIEAIKVYKYNKNRSVYLLYVDELINRFKKVKEQIQNYKELLKEV